MGFEKRNIISRCRMSEKELNSYYRNLRVFDFYSDKPVRSLKLQKLLNYICLKALRLDRLFVGRKLEVFADKRINTNKPHIFACSHVGRYDIESAMEAIKTDAFFVMGDPGKSYLNFEGLFLNLYGRLCLDTGYQFSDELINLPSIDLKDPSVMKKVNDYLNSDYADPELVKIYNDYTSKYGTDKLLISYILKAADFEIVDTDHLKLLLEYKVDRHISLLNCIKYLKVGHNILIYPEGAWNLTANLLTMKLFDGSSIMATEGGADIIPVGIVKYGKRYIINIGENIEPNDYGSVKEITSALRDSLSSLKYDIMVEETKKDKTVASSLEAYVDEIMSETTNGYDLSVINGSKFIDKIPSPDEVFGPIKKLSKFK